MLNCTDGVICSTKLILIDRDLYLSTRFICRISNFAQTERTDMKRLLLLVFTVTGGKRKKGQGQECYEVCSCDKRLIDCHGQNLAGFTINEKESDITSVTKLDLRYNDLPTFPVLPKMPKLQQIVLQGNQISSFEKDTFILSPQINMISLQENELQTLSTGMFDHLSFIKTIYLQKNAISDLKKYEFYLECRP